MVDIDGLALCTTYLELTLVTSGQNGPFVICKKSWECLIGIDVMSVSRDCAIWKL